MWGDPGVIPALLGRQCQQDSRAGSAGKVGFAALGNEVWCPSLPQVEPEKLKTLTEGLEAFSRARKRNRK